jgi:hypothetical protein
VKKDCVVCGKTFDAKGSAKTCGPVCSRERERKRKQEWLAKPEYRERDRERHAKPEYRDQKRKRYHEDRLNFEMNYLFNLFKKQQGDASNDK